MVSSGTGASSTVDLNTIPMAAVKRIEILKDGASAVYGSDAIRVLLT
jgi:iron complex outermembrane receptor protein